MQEDLQLSSKSTSLDSFRVRSACYPSPLSLPLPPHPPSLFLHSLFPSLSLLSFIYPPRSHTPLASLPCRPCTPTILGRAAVPSPPAATCQSARGLATPDLRPQPQRRQGRPHLNFTIPIRRRSGIVSDRGRKIPTIIPTPTTRGANIRRPRAGLHRPNTGPSQRTTTTMKRRNFTIHRVTIHRADVARPHPRRCPEATAMSSLTVVTVPRQGPHPEISTLQPGLEIPTESHRSNSRRTPAARRSLIPIAEYPRRRRRRFRPVSEIQTTNAPAVTLAMPNQSTLVMRSPRTLPTHRLARRDGPDPLIVALLRS
jgi:hypothetical protein